MLRTYFASCNNDGKFIFSKTTEFLKYRNVDNVIKNSPLYLHKRLHFNRKSSLPNFILSLYKYSNVNIFANRDENYFKKSN